MSNKILFILKRREDYNTVQHTKVGLQTGLYNSASYVNEMLNDMGIQSEISIVRDNNDIDREVTLHKPTHVIIEALWVVPSKFAVLTKLHPNVKWIIRLHSEVPFLANEGIAMDWIADYCSFKNLSIAANSPRAFKELGTYLKSVYKWSKKELDEKVLYFPNFYPQKYLEKEFVREKDFIDIGCFGAVRPMKNHFLQAFAAVKFAERIGKKLKFHINTGRVEMKGEPIIQNLQSFFIHLQGAGHELVIHDWMEREDFLKLAGTMDIGTQFSMSETFNIVIADVVSQGVPIVASDEVPWMNHLFCGNPVDSEDIYKALILAYKFPKFNVWSNQRFLTGYTEKTKNAWEQILK